MDTPRDPDLARRLFGERPEHTLALLRAAWPAAVGPEIARRTEVVAFDRGVLRVKVPDPGWQKNLLRVRGDILGRLRRIAGQAAPHALGFVQGPLAEAPAPPSPPPSPPPVRAPEAPPAVAEAAAAIPDPELRARFLAVAGRYLARFSAAQTERSGSGTTAG
jgi:hypothetical protein